VSMEKQINIPNIVMSTTIEDFSRYLNSFNKNNHVKCSTCGNVEWEIFANPNDANKPVIVTLPLPMTEGAGIWSFYLMCKNCGEMKLINTNKVAAWLHKNKK
jgi:hypothetical protein